jgi:flagellar basal-body rod modification protein FlgD
MTVRAVQTNAAAAPQPAKPAASDQGLGKDTFLKLLIAQVRNQDPMNPADGVQFMTQLAQFSELEQLMEMRKDLQIIREQAQQAAGSTPPDDTQTQ